MRDHSYACAYTRRDLIKGEWAGNEELTLTGVSPFLVVNQQNYDGVLMASFHFAEHKNKTCPTHQGGSGTNKSAYKLTRIEPRVFGGFQFQCSEH